VKKKKLPAFKTVIELARKAGACEDELKEVEKLGCWRKVRKHKRAPYWACWYAYNVLQGSWPEAEDIIMRDYLVAIAYICKIKVIIRIQDPIWE